MERFFNTEGPCEDAKHYMLPAESRVDADVERLIERERYFVIHAPRQVGKTTAFHALARRLTSEGHYTALLTTCEVGQSTESDLEHSIGAVLGALHLRSNRDLPEELRPPAADPGQPAGARLWDLLQRWAFESPRPLVIFFDEIDSLKGDALISVLRQLRGGFADRPRGFPHSLPRGPRRVPSSSLEVSPGWSTPWLTRSRAGTSPTAPRCSTSHTSRAPGKP